MAGTGPTDPDPPDPKRIISTISIFENLHSDTVSWSEYGVLIKGQQFFLAIQSNAWVFTDQRAGAILLTENAYNLLRSSSSVDGGLMKSNGVVFALFPVVRGDVTWAVASTT